jgi:hypothetical protein
MTRLVTLVSALAALDIVLAAIPLIPYGPSAGALVKPSEGIFLGPGEESLQRSLEESFRA